MYVHTHNMLRMYVYICPSLGPSAPVANATAISSTAINVTWTEPEFRNGVLQSYTVTGKDTCTYVYTESRNCEIRTIHS